MSTSNKTPKGFAVESQQADIPAAMTEVDETRVGWYWREIVLSSLYLSEDKIPPFHLGRGQQVSCSPGLELSSFSLWDDASVLHWTFLVAKNDCFSTALSAFT